MTKKKNTMKDEILAKGSHLMSDIRDEILQEETLALRDFIKGGYRLLMEKEKEVEKLLLEKERLSKAIALATKGDWTAFQEIKIPARLLDESTLRKRGKVVYDGETEVGFVDLYKN